MVYIRIQAEADVTLLVDEFLKMEIFRQGQAASFVLFCFVLFCLFVCLFVCLFCIIIIGMARQSDYDNVAYLRQLSYRNRPLKGCLSFLGRSSIFRRF